MNWERAKAMSGWVVASILAVSLFAVVGIATNPSFDTTIQPGSMVSTSTYIVFTDGTNYFARNGKTGAIQYSGLNDSAVIQSTITATQAAGVGGSIEFAPGNYPLASGLSVTMPIVLRSAWSATTNLSFFGVRFYATTPGITMIRMSVASGYTGPGEAGGGIEGIFLDCNYKASVGLNITGVNTMKMTFQRLTVQFCTHLGIYVGQNHSFYFYSTLLAFNGANHSYDAGVQVAANDVNFYGLNLERNYGTGMIIGAGAAMGIYGGAIESNAFYGVNAGSSSWLGSIQGVDFESNGRIGQSNIDDLLINAAYFSVSNCEFASTQTYNAIRVTNYPVYLSDLFVYSPKVLWTSAAHSGTIQLNMASDMNASSVIPKGVNVQNTNVQGFSMTQPGVGSSGVYVSNPALYPANVYITKKQNLTQIGIKDGAGAQDGVFTGTFSDFEVFNVPAGGSIELTYTGTAPSWSWEGK